MRSLKYDPPSYTVADYHMWEGQWELIDGIPYAMSPSPSQKHQWLAVLIAAEVVAELRQHKSDCGKCRVMTDIDWVINDSTVLRPDVAVVCDPIDTFITAPPVLIVEIASPSTALKDRKTKFDIYQTQGIAYYILADPATYTFAVYALENGSYVETHTTTFTIHNSCSITLDLSPILEELRNS
ncbi:MAG: Uma2 family endonuclease [Bacteroidetes bacterium]|nr:Uma2 family endonuclease [Bacteroidota bacterium]